MSDAPPRHEQAKLLGDNRGSQVLRIVTLVLVVAVLGGVMAFGRSVGDLNTDDKLIDRGQAVTNCIGIRADLIDDWRAISGEAQADGQTEFLLQVRAVSNGEDVDISRGLAATARQHEAQHKIRLLVQEKRDIREQSRDLINSEDPGMVFHCPPVADELNAPPP